MSIVTLPALFRPRSCQLTPFASQRVSAAPFGGSEQAIDLLNDRWLLSCELPAARLIGAGWREAFIGAMRGQVNTVALWHFARPVPRGSLRGALSLTTSAAQGAASLSVTGGAGQANATLLAGDMLGVGGLLLMVASDCTANASGIVTVPLTNRLRVAQSSAAVVTWDKPTALFRLLSTSGVQYEPGVSQPVTFDFGEKI